jgi:CheY-like chemotaxis protein
MTPLEPPASVSVLSQEVVQALGGSRLMVVDDEPDALEVLVLLLSGCGAEVRAVSSAAEALTAFDGWRADVLISDIGMPGEDGYDLIRRIRALPSGQGGETPAIALTAHARPEDLIQALAAGFQAHVAKPVDQTELVLVTAGLLRRHRGASPAA